MSSKVYSNIDPYIKDLEKLRRIKEVFQDNFVEEMTKISKLIDRYNYVSMDTEFPGVVLGGSIHYSHSSPEMIYKYIKQNVDCLKMIQIGLTLSDRNGNFPEGVCTWQFNVDFDLTTEKYNQESISLLMNSGINFQILSKCGISIDILGEYFMTSGLILNDNICWISYHGSYDFAYFLKMLTGQAMPDRLEVFLCDLDLYFKNFYDIRYLVKDELEGNRLSLNKLANDLSVEIIGSQHQAGSDSMVTSNVYFKVRENVVNEIGLFNGKNKLFSLSNNCLEDEKSSSSHYKSTSNYSSQNSQENQYMYNSPQQIYGVNYAYDNYMFNGNVNNLNNMNNMNSMNNYQFYNMIVNKPMQSLQNCVVPTIFNSGSSTASGGSFTQQVPVVKKKKSKKEKKKKAKKVAV